MKDEESMKCRKNLWFQGAALLLIAITVLLSPGAGAQSKYKTLHRFKGLKGGTFVVAGLTFDQKGNLYGASQLGGAGLNGIVFKLAPNADGSWTESVLYNFTGGADGGTPSASLILDQAGNLYGTAFEGGFHEFGTVFQLTPRADGSWAESRDPQLQGRYGRSQSLCELDLRPDREPLRYHVGRR
jgi:uncharacterized repeat protein (TIGR03803 family)